MTHRVNTVGKTSAAALPRGLVITVLALMSWGLVLTAWVALFA